MQRNEWKFDYTAGRLAQAAAEKIAFHQERLEFWRATREGVLDTIRAEGLEIDQKIAIRFPSPKSRDWEHGAEVTIRNDLQKNMTECQEKLKWHTDKLAEYVGWQQVLLANPENRQSLDIDDWLFFFSKP